MSRATRGPARPAGRAPSRRAASRRASSRRLFVTCRRREVARRAEHARRVSEAIGTRHEPTNIEEEARGLVVSLADVLSSRALSPPGLCVSLMTLTVSVAEPTARPRLAAVPRGRPFKVDPFTDANVRNLATLDLLSKRIDGPRGVPRFDLGQSYEVVCGTRPSVAPGIPGESRTMCARLRLNARGLTRLIDRGTRNQACRGPRRLPSPVSPFRKPS